MNFRKSHSPLYLNWNIINFDDFYVYLQNKAINMMLEREICLFQRPPGTGKTTAAAHGIFKLHLVDPGLSIVACPSNFAGEVLFKKLLDAREKFEIPVKVLRIEATSRENKYVEDNSDLP